MSAQLNLEEDAAKLETRFREALEELRSLRLRLREADSLAERTRAEICEIRTGWDAIHYRRWMAVLAGVIGFLVAAYAWRCDPRR